MKPRFEEEDDPLARAEDFVSRNAMIRAEVAKMLDRQATCYLDTLLPALADKSIHLVTWDALTSAQRDEASIYFDHNISPALTPLGLDATHPFPFMSNQSTNWGFVLRDHATNVTIDGPDQDPHGNIGMGAAPRRRCIRRASVRATRRTDPRQCAQAVPGAGNRRRHTVPDPAQCRNRAR